MRTLAYSLSKWLQFIDVCWIHLFYNKAFGIVSYSNNPLKQNYSIVTSGVPVLVLLTNIGFCLSLKIIMQLVSVSLGISNRTHYNVQIFFSIQQFFYKLHTHQLSHTAVISRSILKWSHLRWLEMSKTNPTTTHLSVFIKTLTKDLNKKFHIRQPISQETHFRLY